MFSWKKKKENSAHTTLKVLSTHCVKSPAAHDTDGICPGWTCTAKISMSTFPVATDFGLG